MKSKVILVLVTMIIFHSAFASGDAVCKVSPLGFAVADDFEFPDVDFAIVGVDVGIPMTRHASLYGVGFSLAHNIAVVLFGGQLSLGLNESECAYGVQAGLLGNRAARGVGAQVGLSNVADDLSLRVQLGLWNSTPDGFWDKPVVHPGAYGVQAGLINRYENGGGLQMGFWNNSNESVTFQGGIINGMYDHAYGTQFGIVNLMFGGSCGLQVGLINAIVEDSKGVQVGLLNMRVRGEKSFSPLVGWQF